MSSASPSLPSRARSILIIGAGELGLAIINALLAHPAYSSATTRLILMIRPASLTTPTAEKAKQNDHIRSLGVSIIPGDVEQLSESDLSSLLRDGGYTSVLHAGGMTLQPGTMAKLTRAVIDASITYYVPWQHGVDYDIIGREGGQGMFSEQLNVRDLLRAQPSTDWIVLSCGIFMSFLFEEFWGVVSKNPDSGGKETVRVTALNSWNDWITTTTAEDIGRCTAALLLEQDAPVNKPVYIAGDTLTYGEFADVVARVVEPRGYPVDRQVWPLEHLKQESQNAPEDKLKKYRVVFSEGKGLSWPKESTWSAQKGMTMTGVEEWMQKNWK
jgi:hypothetical protein